MPMRQIKFYCASFLVACALFFPSDAIALIYTFVNLHGELYDPAGENDGGFDVLTVEIGTQAAPKTVIVFGDYGVQKSISGWTIASAVDSGRLAFELQSEMSVPGGAPSAQLSPFIQSTNNRVQDTFTINPGIGPGGVPLIEGEPAQVLLQVRLDGEIQLEGRPSGGMQVSFHFKAGSNLANLPVIVDFATGHLNPAQTFEIHEEWDLLLDVTVGENVWFDALLSGWIGGRAFDPGTSGVSFIKMDPIGRISNAPGYDLEITSEAGAPTTPLPMSNQFEDVLPWHWAYSFIETLADSGVTSGCGNDDYCPSGPVTRAQMAVFLERGINGSDFIPPAASGSVFVDVDSGDFAANFIEQLFADGVTAGCGGNKYCPDDIVTRAQMAVFLLRAKYGSGHSPPAATGVFDDVGPGYWAAAWIEQLATEGITAGCGDGNYCPEMQVTRDQMAVFLVRTFDLQ